MYLKLRILLPSLALIFAIAGFSVTSVFAQSGATTASVTGVLADEQGGVIGGATVKAVNTNTNLTREVTTGENGSYLIPELPPGIYELTITAEGFNTKLVRVELGLGTNVKLDLPLKIATSEPVVVEIKGNTVLEEGKTESSTSQDRGRIDNLPINRRNFLDFTLTSPRVTADRTPQQGAAATSGLSFNGQPARFNNITIDGLDNNDIGSGSVRSTFSQEAVQEFQIVSDSFSAEFGHALGGVVNIVTRGGTNDLHGTTFFFLRNDSTSARDAFASFKPEYRQYQFGQTLSGPIKKDKAFFFTSFERLTIKQNTITTISDASVASARRLGFTLNNGPEPFAIGTTTALARLDLNLSTNDTLFLRYNGGFTYNGGFEPFGGLTSITSSGIQKLQDNTGVISNTYINPGFNLVNETRFLVSKRTQDVDVTSNDPLVNVLAPEGNIVFGQNSLLPQPRQEDIFHIIDNVSLSRGRNQLKFGIDFFYSNIDASLPIVFNSQSVFTPLDFAALTGVPGAPFFTGIEAFDPTRRSVPQMAFLSFLASVLPSRVPGFPANVPLAQLPLPLFFAQGFGDPRASVQTKLFSTFVQDDIKLRQNLLIKLGVRYDYSNVTNSPDLSGNISPRVAFAYRPAKLPKMNLHGSYGIYFSNPVVGGDLADQLFRNDAVKILISPFPLSALAFAQPGHRFPQSAQLPTALPFIPQLSQKVLNDPNLRNGYTHQVSFGVDYAINDSTIASIGYDYVRGIKLYSIRNINPVVRPIPNDAVTSQIIGRLDPTRGTIFEQESAFDSYYNALSISLTRRFANHFSLLAHYTWSKSIDNFIDFRINTVETNNTLDLRSDRGLSLQDARSRFVASGVWDLNYTKNPFLRDFQLSSIITLVSGRPYNLLAGVDLNLDGDFPPGDRPAGLGRNVGITPGFANVDMRLTRSVTFKERYRFSGFVEFFNLFNRTNINEIDRTYPPDAQGNFNLPAKDGGRFTAPRSRFRSAFAPRQIQFGFKFNF